MKIAIIDSGVNGDLFPNLSLKQVRCYENEIVEEEPRDYYGHGTAILSCLYEKYPSFEYLSICPGVDSHGEIDSIVEAYDLANAIRYAIEQKADIINVSMGTTDFSNRKLIDDIVREAYKKNIAVVASAPNETKPALPWACEGAVKVREQKGNGYRVFTEKDFFEVKNFVIQCQLFRVLTKEGKKIFAHGNSYSTVWITLHLIGLKLEYGEDTVDQLCSRLSEDISEEEAREIICQKFDVVEKMYDLENIPYKGKKLVLYSWTKEMHSIVRGSIFNDYKIVGAVDYVKKGYVGRDIGVLSNTSEYGVRISATIEDVKEQADVLVIGYMDQIADKDQKFTLDYILKHNLMNERREIFSFTPVSDEWRRNYEQAGIRLTTPFVFNKDNCRKIFSHVHNFIPIKKPVLGVFGTSSKQGKFTFQINLKEELKKRQINCYHLSTEHQAAFLGANMTFADGYENNLTINVNLETKLNVLRSLMVYIDNTSKDDFILVGGQSWVIPYNIKEQTFMRYAIFLEAVQPDCAVLVINPLLDNEEYVKDTIAVMSSLYKCRTIATAFSDRTPYIEGERIRYKHLSTEDIENLSDQWSKILDLPCGCITDKKYISYVTDCICKEFQYNEMEKIG